MLTHLSLCSVLDEDTLRQLNIGIESDTVVGEARHEMSVPRAEYNLVFVGVDGSKGTELNVEHTHVISLLSFSGDAAWEEGETDG
jgi:hypothetical protein